MYVAQDSNRVTAILKSANAMDKDATGVGVLVSVSAARNSPLTLELRPFKIKLVCGLRAAKSLLDPIEPKSLTKD